jgi:hypothetical protein
VREKTLDDRRLLCQGFCPRAMTYSLRLTASVDKVAVTPMGIWVGWARVHQVTRVSTWLEKTNSNFIMTRVSLFLLLPLFT